MSRSMAVSSSPDVFLIRLFRRERCDLLAHLHSNAATITVRLNNVDLVHQLTDQVESAAVSSLGRALGDCDPVRDGLAAVVNAHEEIFAVVPEIDVDLSLYLPFIRMQVRIRDGFADGDLESILDHLRLMGDRTAEPLDGGDADDTLQPGTSAWELVGR